LGGAGGRRGAAGCCEGIPRVSAPPREGPLRVAPGRLAGPPPRPGCQGGRIPGRCRRSDRDGLCARPKLRRDPSRGRVGAALEAAGGAVGPGRAGGRVGADRGWGVCGGGSALTCPRPAAARGACVAGLEFKQPMAGLGWFPPKEPPRAPPLNLRPPPPRNLPNWGGGGGDGRLGGPPRASCRVMLIVATRICDTQMRHADATRSHDFGNPSQIVAKKGERGGRGGGGTRGGDRPDLPGGGGGAGIDPPPPPPAMGDDDVGDRERRPAPGPAKSSPAGSCRLKAL